MITLKLVHYSYAEMVIFEKALDKAYLSVKCSQPHCTACHKVRVCTDISSALHYIRNKIAYLEMAEPDPPSDCF